MAGVDVLLAQPEKLDPLPDDDEMCFNYAGSGSWESTRDLAYSARDGFLPWVIVGSIAPRHLIHAHEFAWDGARDPVWKRYEKIWGLHSANDKLSVAHGHGTLTGQNPQGSHCNNIGAVHRRQIHEAFDRWLGIDVPPEAEFSQRRPAADLACLTNDARQQFAPRRLLELLQSAAQEQLAAARQLRDRMPVAERRIALRRELSSLLGIVEAQAPAIVHAGAPHIERRGNLVVTRETLKTEPGITVPLMKLSLDPRPSADTAAEKVWIALADDGIAGILQRRGKTISEKLHSGQQVILVEVRGAGASRPGNDRGPQSRLTALSATSLMLGDPLLAGQLRDVRSVWRRVKAQNNTSRCELEVLGDSSVTPLPADADFAHPHRVAGRPPECQPMAPLVALLFALLEDDVRRVETHGSLLSFASVLDSPFVQVPHASIPPGLLARCDLADVVAALAPRAVHLSGLVDGRGRRVRGADAQAEYAWAIEAYAAAATPNSLTFSDLADQR
jgi:hypothetical protein